MNHLAGQPLKDNSGDILYFFIIAINSHEKSKNQQWLDSS